MHMILREISLCETAIALSHEPHSTQCEFLQTINFFTFTRKRKS